MACGSTYTVLYGPHSPFNNSHLCPITTSDKHVAHFGWATLLISYYSSLALHPSQYYSDGKKKTKSTHVAWSFPYTSLFQIFPFSCQCKLFFSYKS